MSEILDFYNSRERDLCCSISQPRADQTYRFSKALLCYCKRKIKLTVFALFSSKATDCSFQEAKTPSEECSEKATEQPEGPSWGEFQATATATADAL